MYPGSGADRKISIRAAPPSTLPAPSRATAAFPTALPSDQNPRKRDKVIAVQSMKYAGGHGGRARAGNFGEDEESGGGTTARRQEDARVSAVDGSARKG